MFSQDKLAELAATPLFAGQTPCAFDELLSELQVKNLSGGAILFRAGDAGDSMYVVLSGRLRVSVQCADGAEEIIREIAGAKASASSPCSPVKRAQRRFARFEIPRSRCYRGRHLSGRFNSIRHCSGKSLCSWRRASAKAATEQKREATYAR
jgi:CRP-like cAMP-binding protein